MFFSDNLITFKFLKNKRKTESEVHFEENKNILISAKFYKAIEFAAEAHDGQMRKSTSVPYISHPFAVAAMLQNQGCEEHVIIAGLLHDTVEDTRVTIDDIRHEFGARVADIVNIVTEPNKSIPWKERKRYMIDTIKSANSDAKCVICADKLHNLMSMMHAYETLGEKLWERFRSKNGIIWRCLQVCETIWQSTIKNQCFMNMRNGCTSFSRNESAK